jgi:AcrR family transcriptional regulator
MTPSETRDKIIDAFLGLLADYDYATISLGMIATRAELSLAELREAFDGKLSILAAFTRRIDREVLDGIDAQMADQPARERLFDTLMRRFDALQPYKAAVARLDRAVRADPTLALALAPIALRSQTWMLTAADIDTSGTRGALAARGLVLAFARTVRVWLRDDDPGMARTMAELDKELRRAESGMRRLDDVVRWTAPLRRIACGLRGRRRREREAPRETEPSPSI